MRESSNHKGVKPIKKVLLWQKSEEGKNIFIDSMFIKYYFLDCLS